MPTTTRPCAAECINREAHMPTTTSPLGLDRTLESLARHGDIEVRDSGHFVTIDLFVRRSGTILYGSGPTLGGAINDTFNELIDHVDAIDHLEDLGIDPLDIGRLTESFGEYDSELDPRFTSAPLDPAFTMLPAYEVPVAATAGQPDEAVALTPETGAAIDAVIDMAIDTIDTTGAGYILALLIPVREGRA